MAKKLASKKTQKKYPSRAADVPVTQRMLYLVRDEMKADVRGLRSEMNGKFVEVESKFEQRFTKIDVQLAPINKRFDRFDVRFDQADKKFAEIDARFDRVDKKFAEIDARFDQMDKKFAQIDERFDRIDARFVQIDARLDRIEARFDQFAAETNAKFEKLSSEIHRLALLIEEQNARNSIVLDGLTSLFYRQERVESDFVRLTKMLPFEFPPK